MDILNYKKPGAAAAMTYFWPGLGHFYSRDYVSGLKWSVMPLLILVLYAAAWIAINLTAAVTLLYLTYMIIIPFACKSAFNTAHAFNSTYKTNDGGILEDPSTAFMITIAHPGLGHLYIGEITSAVRILRITGTMVFLPVLFFSLKIALGGIIMTILAGAYYFLGSFIIGKNAYEAAKRINIEKSLSEETNKNKSIKTH